jgi:polyribonucleotide nucleotidyltransferase
LYEDDLKDAFVKAFNSLLENREEILEGYEAIIETLTDTSRLDKESARLQSECEVVAELVRKCVEENASTVMNQKDYQERYTELVERYEEIKRAISENCNKRQEGNARKESIKDFIRMLEKSEALLAVFDEEVWNATVESVYINTDKKITFSFKDGLELDWII